MSAGRPSAPLLSAAFAPTAGRWSPVATDGMLTVWDLATGKPRATLDSHTGLILAVAFAPDGKTLVSSALQDQALMIWDTATWQVIRTVPAAGAVTSVAFSPDGKTLVVGTSAAGLGDNALVLFDVVLVQVPRRRSTRANARSCRSRSPPMARRSQPHARDGRGAR